MSSEADNDPTALLERGDSFARGGDPDRAATFYTRAIEINPSALIPRFRRAHIRLFELDDAAGALEDLLFIRDHEGSGHEQISPCNLEHLLGESLFRLGRYQDAVEHFEDALALGHDPVGWAEQHLRLAECWEILGNEQAMADALQAFVDLAPQADPEAEDLEWAQTELARLRP